MKRASEPTPDFVISVLHACQICQRKQRKSQQGVGGSASTHRTVRLLKIAADGRVAHAHAEAVVLEAARSAGARRKATYNICHSPVAVREPHSVR